MKAVDLLLKYNFSDEFIIDLDSLINFNNIPIITETNDGFILTNNDETLKASFSIKNTEVKIDFNQINKEIIYEDSYQIYLDNNKIKTVYAKHIVKSDSNIIEILQNSIQLFVIHDYNAEIFDNSTILKKYLSNSSEDFMAYLIAGKLHTNLAVRNIIDKDKKIVKQP